MAQKPEHSRDHLEAISASLIERIERDRGSLVGLIGHFYSRSLERPHIPRVFVCSGRRESARGYVEGHALSVPSIDIDRNGLPQILAYTSLIVVSQEIVESEQFPAQCAAWVIFPRLSIAESEETSRTPTTGRPSPAVNASFAEVEVRKPIPSPEPEADTELRPAAGKKSTPAAATVGRGRPGQPQPEFTVRSGVDVYSSFEFLDWDADGESTDGELLSEQHGALNHLLGCPRLQISPDHEFLDGWEVADDGRRVVGTLKGEPAPLLVFALTDGEDGEELSLHTRDRYGLLSRAVIESVSPDDHLAVDFMVHCALEIGEAASVRRGKPKKLQLDRIEASVSSVLRACELLASEEDA